MGQILIRNLDESVVARLKARARREGKSIEQTAREVLASALQPSRAELVEDLRRIRARTPKKLKKAIGAALVREGRDER